MTYLVDVSTLVARLIAGHGDNAKVSGWMRGKSLELCPIVELGFLRVAGAAYAATPEQAREALADFKQVNKTEWIDCDLSPLEGAIWPNWKKSTDWYLANLAQAHGMKWATLDTRSDHPAAEVI